MKIEEKIQLRMKTRILLCTLGVLSKKTERFVGFVPSNLSRATGYVRKHTQGSLLGWNVGLNRHQLVVRVKDAEQDCLFCKGHRLQVGLKATHGFPSG